uniref:Uncharacterized protein n=1 Tax=Ananas comosus var. bracteatus TaxID=296719 RepID=A0A6V7QL70_ANACO|nr:unnamed protein product [Ananas comosus var. bracteatus]
MQAGRIPKKSVAVELQYLRLVDTSGEGRDKSESRWREIDAKRTRFQQRVPVPHRGVPVSQYRLSDCSSRVAHSAARYRTASAWYRYSRIEPSSSAAAAAESDLGKGLRVRVFPDELQTRDLPATGAGTAISSYTEKISFYTADLSACPGNE